MAIWILILRRPKNAIEVNKNNIDLFTRQVKRGWFVDSNGIYHLEESSENALGLQPNPGQCKNTKYIQCVPNTLAYEYTNFQDEIPLYPYTQPNGVHEGDCEEDAPVCETLNISHQGNIWERTLSLEGGDSSSETITFDEKRGVIEYTSSFSGGMEKTLTAQLK